MEILPIRPPVVSSHAPSPPKDSQNLRELSAVKADKDARKQGFLIEVVDLRTLAERREQFKARQNQPLDLNTQRALKSYLDTHFQSGNNVQLDLYV